MKPETVIAAIKERAKRDRAEAERLAQVYPDAIILRQDQPDNTARPWIAAIIHPSSRSAGRWQVSVFDLDGFAYDYSEPTYAEAIRSARQSGMKTVDMDLLDRVGETARFMGGVIWSQLPDAQKWTTRLADVVASLET